MLVLAIGGCELFDFPDGALGGDGGGDSHGSCPMVACAAPTPACDVASGNCYECVANSDCPSDRAVCDAHACRGCREDSECDSGATEGA